MNSIQHLLHYNTVHLQQGLTLIRGLSGAAFKATQSPVYSSCVGEHLRHILEHYSCFLEGLGNSRIDYDARGRDERISGDRDFAAATILEIVDKLNEINADDSSILIKMSGSKEEDETSSWSASTVKRELQYLQAHTIHHYALIALILKIQGINPPEELGVAPSTLRHRLESEKDAD